MCLSGESAVAFPPLSVKAPLGAVPGGSQAGPMDLCPK